MTIRHPGATLQRSFFVDRDDIRHHSRCAGCSNSVHISWNAAVQAGYEKLVAPNALVISYVETVLSSLIDLPLPGRVLEEKIRFSSNPVYASDLVFTTVSISSWNADTGLMTVSFGLCKEEGKLPVCGGSMVLVLK